VPADPVITAAHRPGRLLAPHRLAGRRRARRRASPETANAAAKHSPASPRRHKPAPATHTNCPMNARTLEGMARFLTGQAHPLPAVYLTLKRALGDLSGYWSRRASLSAGETR